jgi:hypothetical protein
MIAVIPEEAPMAHARSVRNGGEIIVDYLVREKVPYVFRRGTWRMRSSAPRTGR